MLKHIGLQVSQNDFEELYTKIFNGEERFSFMLEEEIGKAVFDIEKRIKVVFMMIGEVEMEFFIHDKEPERTYNHICMKIPDPKQVYEKAMESGYWTYQRCSNDKETYFIRDNSGNMFELKDQ